MRMPTYDKLDSYFTYLKHVDDMPADMCLVAAKSLFQGESCLQDLTLAERYYNRYIAETESPKIVDFLEELKIDLPVINAAIEMYSKGRYDIVLSTLEPLCRKNYGKAFLYVARALAKTNPMQQRKCNQYFINAAVLGSAHAAYYLGTRLLSGKANELVEPYEIQSEAISYLQLSFNFGYTYAGIYLATLFEKGTRLTKNLQNALEVYQKVHRRDPRHAEKIAELEAAIAKETPKSPFLSPAASKLLLADSKSPVQPPATPCARARRLNLDNGASAAYSPVAASKSLFDESISQIEHSAKTSMRARRLNNDDEASAAYSPVVASKSLFDEFSKQIQPPATPFVRARRLDIEGASAAYSSPETTQPNTERSPQTPKRIRLTFEESAFESPEQQQSPSFWLSKGNLN